MQALRINLLYYYGLRCPRKSMISFCFETKLYKQVRRTCFGHGLSDEEKKNTSDNFELHLWYGELKKQSSRTYRLFFSKRGYFAYYKIAKINSLRRRVDSDGNAYGLPAWAEWS